MLIRFLQRGRRGIAALLIVAFSPVAVPFAALAQEVPEDLLEDVQIETPVPSTVISVPEPEISRPPAPAVPRPSMASGTPKAVSQLKELNFRDAPLDQILSLYGELTGRTMIKSPGINATITLKSQTPLSEEEVRVAIESALAMNNVVLVPMGEKFFKVVQPGAARQEGMEINLATPGQGFGPTDALISQVFNLQYVEIAEVTPILQSLIHGYGKIQPLERSNSLLITDTSSNLKIVQDVLSMLDQPAATKVEIKIYEIRYSEAAKIAARLNELIADSQAKEDKPRVEMATPAPVPAAPPGVMRARAAAANASSGLSADLEAALAERGIVQGKVKIIADERTNILIVISRPSNFTLFDKIIAVLDRPVDPEIIVRVLALEYADAEEMAGILNSFIGAAKADAAKGTAAVGTPAEGGQPPVAARALEDFVRQRASERIVAAGGEPSKIGQLSPNTKILSDKRTNSILLMGTKGDIAALLEVIDKIDVMLAQVLIEAVILEVGLGKSVSYGVDWLQRSMTIYNNKNKSGLTVRDPLASYGGGWKGSESTFIDASTVSRNSSIASLTYYFTLFDLNIDAVIKMAAESSDARVLSTPVILTTDNTEAEINSSDQVPVINQTSTTEAGQTRSSYEYRDIGVKLKVKPRINPARYVVMEITQTADIPGREILIGGNPVPEIKKREMKAQIAVPSRSTVVLGGLVRTDNKKSRTKIPILGDIPLLGALFRSDSDTSSRTELLVLITPYVLMTPEEARQETERLHRASKTSEDNWQRGWSDSPLGDLTPAERQAEKKAEQERLRRQKELERAREKGAASAQPTGPTPRVTLVEAGSLLEENDFSTTGVSRVASPVEPEKPSAPPAASEPEATDQEEPVVVQPETTSLPKSAKPDDDLNAPVPL